MNKFAVFGNPIKHSLSPLIHAMFAKEVELDIEYNKVLVGLEEFEPIIEAFFFKQQGIGCNVTVPFKEQAFRLVKHCDHAANLAKAVNTIHLKEGELYGYNTDGIGLVNDLLSKDIVLANKSITLLGAGGAARGAIHPLLDAGVTRINIVNRSHEKATQLATEVNNEKVMACCYKDIDSPGIIINSTSASLYNSLPDGLNKDFMEKSDAAYDMVYSKQPTAFMKLSLDAGVKATFDGLGMLVEQAAEAFRIWTQYKVSTEGVKQEMKNMD